MTIDHSSYDDYLQYNMRMKMYGWDDGWLCYDYMISLDDGWDDGSINCDVLMCLKVFANQALQYIHYYYK